MTKTEIAKVVARVVTMYGTNKIINGIISNNVPIPNLFTKIAVKVTAIVIDSFVSDFIGKYVDEKIDALSEALQGRKIA